MADTPLMALEVEVDDNDASVVRTTEDDHGRDTHTEKHLRSGGGGGGSGGGVKSRIILGIVLGTALLTAVITVLTTLLAVIAIQQSSSPQLPSTSIATADTRAISLANALNVSSNACAQIEEIRAALSSAVIAIQSSQPHPPPPPPPPPPTTTAMTTPTHTDTIAADLAKKCSADQQTAENAHKKELQTLQDSLKAATNEKETLQATVKKREAENQLQVDQAASQHKQAGESAKEVQELKSELLKLRSEKDTTPRVLSLSNPLDVGMCAKLDETRATATSAVSLAAAVAEREKRMAQPFQCRLDSWIEGTWSADGLTYSPHALRRPDGLVTKLRPDETYKIYTTDETRQCLRNNRVYFLGPSYMRDRWVTLVDLLNGFHRVGWYEAITPPRKNVTITGEGSVGSLHNQPGLVLRRVLSPRIPSVLSSRCGPLEDADSRT